MHIINIFQGGSLNDILEKEEKIIKRYSGSIPRGFEKLKHEYEWFNQIPKEIRNKYSNLFPIPLFFEHNKKFGYIELHLNKFNRLSLSKSILGKSISTKQAQVFLRISLRALLDILYKMRTDWTLKPRDGYDRYQKARINLAKEYLFNNKDIDPFIKASEVIVNGIKCPTVKVFLEWLEKKCDKIYVSKKRSSIHGNFHLDNILIDEKNYIDLNSVTLIDPRGDLLGYPHYDISKLLISLEGYYDEINYGAYKIKSKQDKDICLIQIEIDTTYDEYYSSCLAELMLNIGYFSDAEGVKCDEFLWMVYATQCIHILSFCFYHANKIATPSHKILAYLSIFSLMANRLIETYENGSLRKISTQRLNLNLTSNDCK